MNARLRLSNGSLLTSSLLVVACLAGAPLVAMPGASDALGAQGAPGADELDGTHVEDSTLVAPRRLELEPQPLAERPMDAYRGELLDVAFSAASAFPLRPHIKNRSRAQEQVVRAALELGQPIRARRYANEIANWRKGLCYALIASYHVENGHHEGLDELLDVAEGFARAEQSQKWRSDRIRSNVAHAYLLLGEPAEAAPFEADLERSEVGPIQEARFRLLDPENFDGQLAAMREIIDINDFEELRNSLETFAPFFDRFYEDEERRTEVEETLRRGWSKTPPILRVRVLSMLARFAADHGDSEKSRELVDEIASIVDGRGWTFEDSVSLNGELAGLYHDTGAAEEATRRARRARELFDEHRAEIVDVWRSRALRPLAESHWEMGDADAAAATYLLALNEGVENPNSRPRADDLIAICCSMAANGFEPGEALWKRIREIHDALGDPW